MKRSLAALDAAFPDDRMQVGQVVTEGDAAAVRRRATRIDEGEFLGIAPTRRASAGTGSDVDRFECVRIVEVWSKEETLARSRKRGALPP